MSKARLGRGELLGWINTCIGSDDYHKVEQLASGVAYCRFWELLHPKSIPIGKLVLDNPNFFDKNWAMLQKAFLRRGVHKEIPVDKLVKGKFVDNFEFLKWFYDSFSEQVPPEMSLPGRHQRYFHRLNEGLAASTDPPADADREQQPQVEGRPAEETVRMQELSAELQRHLEVEWLEFEHMTHILATGAEERDFYFDKLRNIEAFSLEAESRLLGEGSAASPDELQMVHDVLRILHRSE